MNRLLHRAGFAALVFGTCGAAWAATPGNTLVWSVRDVERTHGFIVYRSPAEQGPFRRLNPSLIPVSAGVGEYRYVDHDVRTGAVYYYRIEAVSQTGIKKALGQPVAKKTAAGAPIASP